MRHFDVTFQPDNKKVRIHENATLLEAAGLANIILNTPCGGKGTCGKCEVELTDSGKKVLACQYEVERNLEVFVPEESRLYKHKILDKGLEVEKLVNPCVEKFAAKAADIKGNNELSLTEKAKEQLDGFEDDEVVTAVARCNTDPEIESGKKIWGFEKGDTSELCYGVAVDIGTTTVVAKLVNLRDGKDVDAESDFNPQNKYGDDVISRINEADSDDKLKELQEIIIKCIDVMTGKICEKNGISTDNVYELVVVGNTTMNHIFLGFPVSQLGQAPYEAYSVDSYEKDMKEWGFKNVSPYSKVYTVENIAGFVGADTVAASLAVEMDKNKDHTLLVDIGTNGELVLGTEKKLYAASCAAGPALEGARIMHGSRAMEGAIEAVVVNNEDIDIDVIGTNKARSICGSGLIDAVAVMLEIGVVDSMGRMKEEGEGLPGKIAERIISYEGQPAFCLTRDDNGEPKIILTQKDIREMQLAKAAIRAGIELLLKKLELKSNDLDSILLAGAFGNYVRKESAIRIGLLPDIGEEKIHFVGNAAGVGAEWVLIDHEARKYATRLAKSIEYAEIAHEGDFSMVYADCMLF